MKKKSSAKTATKLEALRAGAKRVPSAGKGRAATAAGLDTGNSALEKQIPDKKSGPVRNFKRHAKTEISKVFPEIVESLVKASQKGSLGHTKLLFDVGGVKDELKTRGRGRKEPSLGALLMEELKKRQECEAAAQADLGEGELGATSQTGLEERGGNCGANEE